MYMKPKTLPTVFAIRLVNGFHHLMKPLFLFVHVYNSFFYTFLIQGVQHRMISVDNFFIFLRLLFFAVLLLYVT